MKIALLTPTFSKFSGIDRVLELDAEEYSKKGHDITIFALKATMQSRYAKIIEMGMPKNPLIERIYRLFFYFDSKKIKKYVDMLKDYDAAISYFYPMNWLAYKAKKKYKIRYIYYDFGIAYPWLFGFFERIYMRLFILMNNFTIKNCDEAFSISKFLKNELKKQAGIDSKVKYCKIDEKRFHKGIKGNKIRKKLEKRNVIFTGFIKDDELPYYYAACDLYTTATLWEGFDLPVVEAQAIGKKVVAFDLCSHPEVVKNGILVKPNDINAFAEAITKVLM